TSSGTDDETSLMRRSAILLLIATLAVLGPIVAGQDQAAGKKPAPAPPPNLQIPPDITAETPTLFERALELYGKAREPTGTVEMMEKAVSQLHKVRRKDAD